MAGFLSDSAITTTVDTVLPCIDVDAAGRSLVDSGPVSGFMGKSYQTVHDV